VLSFTNLAHAWYTRQLTNEKINLVAAMSEIAIQEQINWMGHRTEQGKIVLENLISYHSRMVICNW
jgi:hypothetical protein